MNCSVWKKHAIFLVVSGGLVPPTELALDVVARTPRSKFDGVRSARPALVPIESVRVSETEVTCWNNGVRLRPRLPYCAGNASRKTLVPHVFGSAAMVPKFTSSARAGGTAPMINHDHTSAQTAALFISASVKSS